MVCSLNIAKFDGCTFISHICNTIQESLFIILISYFDTIDEDTCVWQANLNVFLRLMFDAASKRFATNNKPNSPVTTVKLLENYKEKVFDMIL